MSTIGANITDVFTAETLKTSGKGWGLGDHWRDKDNKLYKFVKYDDGTANLDLVAGDVVFYSGVTGYTTNTVTADASDGTGQEIGAGVVQATVTEDGSYFWIQIRGVATLSTTIGGTAGDGDPLTATGAADKALTKAAEADSTGVYKPVVAFAQDADGITIVCMFPD